MNNTPTISACIIAYNAEKSIVKCLNSAFKTEYGSDYASEAVIAIDTKTTDNTEKVILQYVVDNPERKIYIFHFDWMSPEAEEDKDSFASARNFALSKCSCEWSLHIDCDEVLINHEFPTNDIDYILISARNFHNGQVNSDYWSPRLFKNNIDISFRWATHEETWHLLKNKKGKFSNMIFIHKEKTLEEAKIKNKWLLSRGMRQLQTEPGNPFVRGQISHSQLIIGNLQKAIYYGTEAMVQGAELEVKALLCIHLYRAYRMMRDLETNEADKKEYWDHAIFWLKYSVAMVPQQLSANALFYDFYKENGNIKAMDYHKNLLEQTKDNSMLPYDIKYSNIQW